QWCGADLHSEGNGEQKGRREVRQTHTEGTPHEERAAARHAPYAAHHARHTLQSTAAGTHTHSPAATPTHTDGRGRSKQERHTRLHRMYMRRERSVVSAPLTEGAHTHKKVQRTQQHNSKVTITKRRSPHTTRIVGPRELQPIFTTSSSFAVGLRPHSSHSTSCRPATTATGAAEHATRNKKGRWCGRPRRCCHCRQAPLCYSLCLWL
ncbi:mucin-associated surface protein (MASP), partial [Trypanosoma cruzi]